MGVNILALCIWLLFIFIMVFIIVKANGFEAFDSIKIAIPSLVFAISLFMLIGAINLSYQKNYPDTIASKTYEIIMEGKTPYITEKDLNIVFYKDENGNVQHQSTTENIPITFSVDISKPLVIFETIHSDKTPWGNVMPFGFQEFTQTKIKNILVPLEGFN